MGRDNNNAGLHMVYYPRHKKLHDDFEDDYNYCKFNNYNTREFRNYMDSSILKSLRVQKWDKFILCKGNVRLQKCACGGKLITLAGVDVSYSFENGIGFRTVPGSKCENCQTIYLYKNKILPVLKQNFYF